MAPGVALLCSSLQPSSVSKPDHEKMLRVPRTLASIETARTREPLTRRHGRLHRPSRPWNGAFSAGLAGPGRLAKRRFAVDPKKPWDAVRSGKYAYARATCHWPPSNTLFQATHETLNPQLSSCHRLNERWGPFLRIVGRGCFQEILTEAQAHCPGRPRRWRRTSAAWRQSERF